MKKNSILMLLLMVSAIASAQKKMTIKTGNGQTVEVSCDGISPKEIAVAPDGTVTFKLEKGEVENTPIVTEKPAVTAEDESEAADSIDTFAEVDSLVEARPQVADSLNDDVLVADSLYGPDSQQTALGFIANTLAEELSPEYAAFEKEHEGTHPGTERELTKRLAKKFFNEDDVETADAIVTLFSGLRFTKDSTFVPTYEQRKPKPLMRKYDVIELSGSLGKDINSLSDAAAGKVKEDDYGDDAENHQKYGGGIKYSRVYIKGEEVDGVWKPNPLGFAYSWGGLVSFSHESKIGLYVDAMGKAGVQIGNDICFGVDALVGAGITPFNTFITNDMNHQIINKSVWCFKYGLQLWGSLNFSKDTYTAIYGRYINSVRPNDGEFNLPKDWEVVLEDFDPSSWTVGLAIGYKFGAYEPLSQDKRLQATLSTGYQICGNKGFSLSAEIDRLTQVSKSTNLTYGLAFENVFENSKRGGNMTSILFSGGFQVRQPQNSWFWGAKLLLGIGEYSVVNSGKNDNYTYEDHSAKPCFKGALQLTSGFKIGKCSQILCNLRAGGHFVNSMKYEGFDESSTKNSVGFDLGASLGYNFTF
ncbi:MAG: hypothetical protein IJ677_06285 [Alphaproteobacteria bacterium]|nr:hypothetical protein [Alphaproteobacteria bacterium]